MALTDAHALEWSDVCRRMLAPEQFELIRRAVNKKPQAFTAAMNASFLAGTGEAWTERRFASEVLRAAQVRFCRRRLGVGP
jgi:hypothetical protein